MASIGESSCDEVAEIPIERILISIQKMLDDIKALPINTPEFENIKNNVTLARNIIEKTDSNGFLAIVNRFYNYYTTNKRAFLERSDILIQSELPLTKKIIISIGTVIKNTGGKTSEMWNHLTAIFYLISLYKKQPDQKLKQLLKEEFDLRSNMVGNANHLEEKKESSIEEEEDEDGIPYSVSASSSSSADSQE